MPKAFLEQVMLRKMLWPKYAADAVGGEIKKLPFRPWSEQK